LLSKAARVAERFRSESIEDVVSFPARCIMKTLFRMWLKKLGFRAAGRRRPARKATVIPRLEFLEDRLAPAAPPAKLTILWVTNTKDDGAGSLRAAISKANDDAGRDWIRFDIEDAAQTINVTSAPLPDIMHPVVIDARPPAGFDLAKQTITIKGQKDLINPSTGLEDASGLTFRKGADNSRVMGLKIVGFANDGILLDQVNYVTIGGTTLAAANTIGNNGNNGIEITGSKYASGRANYNRVMRNFIGIDSANGIISNTGNGVLITNGASFNVIGGVDARNQPDANKRNIIWA
jgi:hypothetical protein